MHQKQPLCDGWSLYTATLPMHLRQNRWRYITGFPLIDLITRAKNLLRKAVISFKARQHQAAIGT